MKGKREEGREGKIQGRRSKEEKIRRKVRKKGRRRKKRGKFKKWTEQQGKKDAEKWMGKGRKEDPRIDGENKENRSKAGWSKRKEEYKKDGRGT